MVATLTRGAANTGVMGGAAFGITSRHRNIDLWVVETNEFGAGLNWLKWNGISLTLTQEAEPVPFFTEMFVLHPTTDRLSIVNSSREVKIYEVNVATPALGALVATSAAAGASGGVLGMGWAPDGSAVAVVTTLSPYLYVFPWNGTTFGSPVSPTAASVAPANSGHDDNVSWHPSSNAIAFCIGSQEVGVCTWNGSACGTLQEPTTPTAMTTAFTCDFSPDGAYVAVGGNNAPSFAVYSWNGSTIGASPAAIGPGSNALAKVHSIKWDLNGEFIFTGGTAIGDTGDTDQIDVWPWTAPATIGARIRPDIDIGAGAQVVGIEINFDNSLLGIFDDFEDFALYETNLSLAGPVVPVVLVAAPEPLQSTEREALRVLGVARGASISGPGASLEVTLGQLLDTLRGDTASPGRYPTDADRLFDLIFAELGLTRPRYVNRNGLLAVIEANLP